MLTDVKFHPIIPTVQLWRIDVPMTGLEDRQSYHSTLGKLLDHTRSHRADSTLVLTVRRNTTDGIRTKLPRVARTSHFRQALKPCKHYAQCTCQYGFGKHYRVEFYTRHLNVQNFHCKSAASLHSPESEAMIAYMVEQWAKHYLSHLARGSVASSSVLSVVGHSVPSPIVSSPCEGSLSDPLLMRCLHSSDAPRDHCGGLPPCLTAGVGSEGRAQRPPGSLPFAGSTFDQTAHRQLPGTMSTTPDTDSLFKCFLGTTTATCSLLTRNKECHTSEANLR